MKPSQVDVPRNPHSNGGGPKANFEESRIPHVCFHRCMFNQVSVYEYSLHLLNGQLAAKTGCSLVFRQSKTAHTLLSHAVETATLLQFTNETLDHLLVWCEIRTAKTTTKAAKARKLLESQHVQTRCSKESIETILNILKDQEEKRNNKKNIDDNKDNDDEDSNHDSVAFVMAANNHMQMFLNKCSLQDIEWAELAEDPATMACQKLLETMDLEEDPKLILDSVVC